MTVDHADVLVLTALKDELDALLAVTAVVRDGWVRFDGDPPLHRVVLNGRHGPIRVAAARLTAMGGVATASLATRLIELIKPRCIAMCGVCAGHPEATELGDVVIAERLFQHDEGKVRHDGFQGDLWVDALRADWLRVAQDMAGPGTAFQLYAAPSPDDWKWWFLGRLAAGRDPLRADAFRRYIPDDRRQEYLQSLLSDHLVELKGQAFVLTSSGTAAAEEHAVLHGTLVQAHPFHILVGPMGSGNAVEASGMIWDRLTTGGMRKLLAVEMEAAAIGRVAHDRRLPFAVVKGVMDRADRFKSDRFKGFGARAAAEVLCKFLCEVELPPSVTSPASSTTAPAVTGGREVARAPMNNEALVKFLGAYGGVEPPQDPVEAATDSQLKSITTVLAFRLTGASGSLIDVGAGRGALLARLGDLDSFRRTQWEYVPVEDVRHHPEIIGLALKLGVHKRVSPISLTEFYAQYPGLGGPQIVFVRNVLHELGIDDTAQLLAHLHAHIAINSLLIIQDLAAFPVAEKGNVCWDRARLCALLEKIGFQSAGVDEVTKSGNLWFNIVATRIQVPSLTAAAVRSLAIEARSEQWREWAKTGALTPTDVARDARIAKIDFDLQFAALTLQLEKVDAAGISPLTRRQQQLAALETFERSLAGFRLSDIHDSTDIPPVRHFKDRANSQDRLEAFLASSTSVAAITGPAMMGKTALVQHVLSNFAHRRKLIHVDALESWSTWNLLESIFSACGVRVPTQVVGRLRYMELATIRGPLQAFVEHAASRTVLVIDHFERLLGPKECAEAEISELLTMWARAEGAKVIITSRRTFSVGVLGGVTIEMDHPVVGRFPQGLHVKNILSTFVAVHEFPDAFIDAIDRHPFMAELAGRILEREGIAATHDPTLQTQLRERLRSKLMERVCTDAARPALLALMHARTALPRAVAEQVANPTSVQEALETGLAYEVVQPTGVSLVSCIRGFRFDRSEDDDENSLPDAGLKVHRKWATSLLDHYKKIDDDPRWLREAYYHTAVSGGRDAIATFGTQFRSELQDAGEYWFIRSKDFQNALWAFHRVAELSNEKDPFVSMRIASCLIRTGQAERGLEMFQEIFTAYPHWTGAKTSCVDGLLYLQRFHEALALLRDFTDYSTLTRPGDSWILGQYGRAFHGLANYEQAVEAFQRQLKLDNSPVVVRSLARSLHRLGRRRQEGEVLRRGYHDHRNSIAMIAAFAGWLSSNGEPARAVAMLEPPLKAEPENAWLAFSYVKALIAIERTGDARKYLTEHGRELHPSFMRPAVEAEVLKAEGQFEKALAILDSSSEDRAEIQHRIGQRAEVFAAWAAESDEAASVSVARQALGEIPESENLLINVSVLKLCILAGDRTRFDSTLQVCRRVNPNSEDVARLELEASNTWKQEP